MYKFVVLATLMAVAAAAPGLVSPLGAIGNPWGSGLIGAPVVSSPIVSAPLVRPVVSHALPVATSYANSVRIATPAVVAAPAIAHGPVVAAPYATGW